MSKSKSNNNLVWIALGIATLGVAYWIYNKSKKDNLQPQSEGKPDEVPTTNTTTQEQPSQTSNAPAEVVSPSKPAIIELTQKEKDDLMFQAQLECERQADEQGMETGIQQYVETCKPSIYNDLYAQAFAKKNSATTTNAIGSNFN